MEITRTANAGILLKLDDVTILLDGVCREVKPYPVTPPHERERLLQAPPDIVAFTHAHKDHYDPDFAAQYVLQTAGVILGPEGLPRCKSTMRPISRGAVRVTPVASRHIGAAGKTTPHASFIVQGSRCLWFLGDSTPLIWKDSRDLPKPDVLVVPYAYATTPTGWQIARNTGAGHIVLLHMPERELDSIGLWNAVEATAGEEIGKRLHIPGMGDNICF